MMTVRWTNRYAALSLLVVMTSAVRAGTVVDEVDVTIGNVGWELKPTRPTVHLPNSMVRFHPFRADARDDQIDYFPLMIGSHRSNGSFSIMPAEGPLTYDHERATPYYYSVWLEEPCVEFEFTPGARCGLVRVMASKAAPRLLLSNRKEGSFEVIDEQRISGSELFSGSTRIFIHGEFSVPVSCVQRAGRLEVCPAAMDARVLVFRYGVSLISVDQARKNLEQELAGRSFDEQVQVARACWEKTLGRIRIEGGAPERRRAFYTALYRCHERMIDITEDGFYWCGADGSVQAAARPYYADNWLWDTYLALEPLHMILNPKMAEDRIASYIRLYEKTGWMPKFSRISGSMDVMTGNHTSAWMADAWFKGLRDFDVAKGYEGNRKNTLEGTLLPWRSGARSRLDDFYAAQGFFPALKPGETETVGRVHEREKRQAVAITLEYSYDDWCLAQLARELGRSDDVAVLMQRAGNYRNVYRAEKGFMWPRDESGAWIEPFDPTWSGGQGARDYFTENNGHQFNWHVRHDFEGLFECMGGHDAAEAKLDELFRTGRGALDGHPAPVYVFHRQFPDSTGMVGQFSMGNEPGFHIPYLYNYLGAPWKTQKRVRMLIDTWFMDNVFGIPGDEDGGAMSAWLVFSSMGFYPVVPGVPVYAVTSPVFDKTVIDLPDGRTFSIVALDNSNPNKYIQSIKLNGQSLNRLWLKHHELMAGGTLTLQMGPRPNRELGARLQDLPPSSMDLNPAGLQ